MKLLRLALVVAAIGTAVPASAGELTLAFKDGRVTLKAVDTPLRQILQEWARLGQTRIVGLEKLTGGPLTLELVDVPEKQALEILLRPIAGYLAAPRAVVVSPAMSRFDRLALLPTSVASTAPLAPRPTAMAPAPAPAANPFPDRIQLANDEGPEPTEAPTPGGVPVFNPNGEPVRPPAPGETPEQPSPSTAPLTAPRPGILPVPPPQPQPRP
jgi:hypothetical protein